MESLKMNDAVTTTYISLVRASLGPRLHELWLFGSRARGDSRPESDYDVVVVADGDQEEVHALVVESNYTMMCEGSALFGALEYSPAQWEKQKRTGLGRNVVHEGVLLYGNG
jgi:predicted nucleotidyltransferase